MFTWIRAGSGVTLVTLLVACPPPGPGGDLGGRDRTGGEMRVVDAQPADATQADTSTPDLATVDISTTPDLTRPDVTSPDGGSPNGALLGPANVRYGGAFKLPGAGSFTAECPGGGGPHSMHQWAEGAKAYNPAGDSLFITGNVWGTYVAEVTIPQPVDSSNPSELNTATFIQPYADPLQDINDACDDIHDLVVLPPTGPQTETALVEVHGNWYEYELHDGSCIPKYKHGIIGMDLSQPAASGPYRLGSCDEIPAIMTSNYIATIPAAWREEHVPGFPLIAGRHREGQEGDGPSLFAYKLFTEATPPPPHTELPAQTLLRYTGPMSSEHPMNDHCPTDNWRGVAWPVFAGKSAVVFAGSKGVGFCWYGWWDDDTGTRVINLAESNYSCSEAPQDGIPCVDCDGGGRPSCDSLGYSGDSRGYVADAYKTVLLFYDPDDFARVVQGEIHAYDPQPYAMMDITPNMLQTVDPSHEIKVTGLAYDEAGGRLFVSEWLAIDGNKPVVHLFELVP